MHRHVWSLMLRAPRRGTWLRTIQGTDGTHVLSDNTSRHDGAGREALVFHVGACYRVHVHTSYDGARDGIINMGSWLFTYEFLQAFLDQLYGCATTFRRYLQTALVGYVRASASAGCGAPAPEHLLARKYLDQMNTHTRSGSGSKKCYQAFQHAVMDFITLQVWVLCKAALCCHAPCAPMRPFRAMLLTHAWLHTGNRL